MKKIFCTLATLLLCSLAQADTTKIYKATDASGQEIYTNTAPFKGAVPAVLPELAKRTETAEQASLTTCVRRGGINCQAGADSDGSVICFDGFAGASARFRFSCSAAKLEIAGLKKDTTTDTIVVTVRNTLSVNAQLPFLYLRIPGQPQTKIFGPGEIPAFGLGEFTIDQSQSSNPLELKAKNLKPSCKNCN